MLTKILEPKDTLKFKINIIHLVVKNMLK